MRTILRTGLALTLVGVLAGCSGAAATQAPPSDAAEATEAPESDVPPAAVCEVVAGPGTVAASATGFTFSPDPVTAAVGEAITWTNGDAAPHTVTLDDGSCDTGQFGQDAAGTLRFSAAGTYPYHCIVHPSMTGTIEITG